MADFLSMLGGGNSNANMFGMSPQDQANFAAMKAQANKQAILPALFALGLGFLGHKRAINGLREGLAGAGRAYEGAYDNSLNQNIAIGSMAQKQREQGVKDAIAVSNAQANQTRADNSTQALRDKETEDTPVGEDWAAKYRNNPQFHDILFPPPEEAAKYTAKQVTDFWSSKAPHQQQAAQQIVIQDRRLDQGDTRNAIAQQNADTASGRLSVETQKWKQKLWGLSPIGSTSDPSVTRFARLRTSLPPNIAATIPSDQDLAAMPRVQADQIFKIYTGDAGKQTAKQLQDQQLNNRLKLNRLYASEHPLNPTPTADDLAAYYAANGYDRWGNKVGNPAGATPAAAPAPAAPATAAPAAPVSPAPAAPVANPATPAPTAAPTAKPAASATPGLPAGALAPTKMPDGTYHKDGKVYVVKGGYVFPGA